MEKFSKKCKEMMVDEIAGRLKDADGIVVTQFDKLPVMDIESFKKELTSQGVKYFVVKNSLCKLAFKKAKIDGIDKFLEGTVGLGIGEEGPEAVAKALVEYEKKNETFKVLGGYVNGKETDKQVLQVIASLPSREVLLAQLFGQFNAPVSQFVSVLSNTLKGFLYAVNEIKQNKEKGDNNG